MLEQDQLFADMSAARREIVYAFERLRFQRDNHGRPIVRRIAEELGYSIDQNKTNTFVRKVVQEYLDKRGKHKDV